MHRQHHLTFLLIALTSIVLLSQIIFLISVLILIFLLTLAFLIYWKSDYVETNEKADWRIFIFIAGALAIAICLVIISYNYITNPLIPVGWDTGRHLYWSRLAYDLQFLHFLEQTDANSFLAPLIIAALARYLTLDIFVIRTSTTYLYCIFLIFIVGWITLRSSKNYVATGLSMLFLVSMISIYRLSADLHKTLLASIFVLLFIMAYTHESLGKEKYPLTITLAALTAISQLEFGILLIGICVLFEFLNLVLRREIHVISLLCAIIGLSVPLLFAILFSTTFVQVLISYPITIRPPTINLVFVFFGSLLFSLFPISLITIFSDRQKLVNNKTLFFVMIFTLAIILFIIIPAFFIETPTIFRKTAPRVIMILPLAVLYGVGSSFIQTKRIRATGKFRNANKVLTCVFFITIISLGTGYSAVEAQRHHQPFVSQDLFNQLTWLENNVRFDKTPIFFTRGLSVYSYKDDGWIGAFMGYHLSYNGPLIFFLLGYWYPSSNIFTNLYNQRLLNEIKEYYSVSLDQISQIPIVILEGSYGHIDYEYNLTRELFEGIYIVDTNNPNFSIEQYCIQVNEHFNTSGKWDFSNIDDDLYVLGRLAETPIYRTYPAVFYKTGNFSINFDCFVSHNSTLRLYLNDTLLDTYELDQIDQRIPISFNLMTLEGISFIKYEITSEFESNVTIGKLSVKTM